MNYIAVLFNRIVLKYSLLPFRKKALFFLTLLLLVLFISVSVQHLITPKLFPQKEMARVLVPNVEIALDRHGEICAHLYEKYETRDQVELVLDVNDTTLAELADRSSDILPGGSWSPKDCISKYHVNIIIPYRHRQEQLRVLLYYIHQFLKLQQIAYRIYVVEQSEEKLFNRGKLFNIGFVEAQRRNPAACYVFHDADLIPLSLNNIYACSDMPRHMSSAVDVFNYELPYNTIFGGVVAMTAARYQQVNGYSNSFYGWGGEDDDLSYRIRKNGLDIVRFKESVSSYRMLTHLKAYPNPDRFHIMDIGRHRYTSEGLNSLEYELLAYKLEPLYTHIIVAV